MIHFDGANISGRRKYDVLTFCEVIFGGTTGGPTGGLRSQVSGLRHQVSGIRSRVSGLRSQVRSLNPPRGLKSCPQPPLLTGLCLMIFIVFGPQLFNCLPLRATQKQNEREQILFGLQYKHFLAPQATPKDNYSS